jgi:hypothetical protein
MLVSIDSPEMNRDHQELMEHVLEPFTRLAGLQTRGLCELHYDDLTQWLTVGCVITKPGGLTNLLTVYETGEYGVVAGSASGLDAEMVVGDEDGGLDPEDECPDARASRTVLYSSLGTHTLLLYSYYTTVLILYYCTHTILYSSLGHIGRVNPELAFLSKLAEFGLVAEMGAYKERVHEECHNERAPEECMGGQDLAAQVAAVDSIQNDLSGFAGFFAQLPSFVSFNCTSSAATYGAANPSSPGVSTSSGASSTSSTPTNEYTNPLPPSQHAAMLGMWAGLENPQNRSTYETYLKVLGYPWFLRQFVMAAMSSQTIVDDPNRGIVVTAVGRFLGFKLRNGAYKEMPPCVFRHQVLCMVWCVGYAVWCCVHGDPSPTQTCTVHGNASPTQTCRSAVSLASPPTFSQHIPQTGSKWQLVRGKHRVGVGLEDESKPPSKLSYRFENTFKTIVTGDGSLEGEMLHINATRLFKDVSVRKMFDFGRMKRWQEELEDADSSGLPKNMVRCTLQYPIATPSCNPSPQPSQCVICALYPHTV